MIHIEPNSHFFTAIVQILNLLRYSTDKEYLIIGLKNTLKRGYDLRILEDSSSRESTSAVGSGEPSCIPTGSLKTAGLDNTLPAQAQPASNTSQTDVDFIKQAFKHGKVEERGVHLRETSMAVESCQQPLTKAKTSATPTLKEEIAAFLPHIENFKLEDGCDLENRSRIVSRMRQLLLA